MNVELFSEYLELSDILKHSISKLKSGKTDYNVLYDIEYVKMKSSDILEANSRSIDVELRKGLEFLHSESDKSIKMYEDTRKDSSILGDYRHPYNKKLSLGDILRNGTLKESVHGYFNNIHNSNVRDLHIMTDLRYYYDRDDITGEHLLWSMLVMGFESLIISLIGMVNAFVGNERLWHVVGIYTWGIVIISEIAVNMWLSISRKHMSRHKMMRHSSLVMLLAIYDRDNALGDELFDKFESSYGLERLESDVNIHLTYEKIKKNEEHRARLLGEESFQ